MVKILCDRCGREVADPVAIVQFGSRRVLQDQMNLTGQRWELCDSCKQDVERVLREGPAREAPRRRS